MTLFKNKEPKDPNILARLKDLAEPREVPEPIVVEHDPESELELEPRKKTGTTCSVCGKMLRRPKRHKCPGGKMTVSIPTNFATVEPSPEPVVIEEPTHRLMWENPWKTEKPIQTGVPVFDLWIDVVVAQSEDLETISFFDFVANCAATVCEAEAVPHWKCVGYGKGPGLLAAACEKKIKESRDLGIILASSASMEFRACESVLRRFAKNIVIGIGK